MAGKKKKYSEEYARGIAVLADYERQVIKNGWPNSDHFERVLSILQEAQFDKNQGCPDGIIWLRIIVSCGLIVPLSSWFLDELSSNGIRHLSNMESEI